jgi:hypothetical protein
MGTVENPWRGVGDQLVPEREIFLALRAVEAVCVREETGWRIAD